MNPNRVVSIDPSSSTRRTFCTIVTKDYIPYVHALHQSLQKFDGHIELNVFVVDSTNHDEQKNQLTFINREDLLKVHLADEIWSKYSNWKNQDVLRWTLKPILIKYLLQNGYEKVIFTDPDTFYFSDYNFLFEELSHHSILLTPCWSGSDPKADLMRFNYQFTDGIYNAGFIGASQEGVLPLSWWAEMCLFECRRIPKLRYFDDQHYLNLFPIYFENVLVLKHRGCNLAGWNIIACSRSWMNHQVVIDGKWPVVFIHFTTITFNAIVNGRDDLLKPHLQEYSSQLLENGVRLDLEKYQFKPPTFFQKVRYVIRKKMKRIPLKFSIR